MMGKLVGRASGIVALAFILLGLVIVLEGRTSGWARLAEQFKGSEEPSGLRLVVREGGLGDPRWYHRIAPLQASMGLGGLSLRYPFPYSLGHPPIQVPWSQIRLVNAHTRDGHTRILLSVSQPERARIALSGDVGAVVREWLAPER